MVQLVPGTLFGLESLYYLAIAAICFLIYFRTREIHKLSSHEGVKYFRHTFLFSGLSSLLKFLTREYAVTFFARGPGRVPLMTVGPLSALLIIYTHLLAALFLVYSISWRNLGGLKDRPWAIYVIALVPIALTFLTMQPAVYLVSQVFIIAYGMGVIHSRQRKKTQMNVIYDLLLLFWTLNILDTLVPTFLVTWQVAIYAASLLLFLTILQRVQKSLGGNRK